MAPDPRKIGPREASILIGYVIYRNLIVDLDEFSSITSICFLT